MTETPIQAPGHEDGCSCDPCIRAQHADTDPRHQRCDEHGRCLACDGCAPCEMEAERDREIGSLAAGWPQQVRVAQQAVSEVRATVARLVDLYDIETAEGPDGADALHELDEILGGLRHVRRIADARYALEARAASAAADDGEPGPDWHFEWELITRDGLGNAILKHKSTGGRYRIIPEEDL